MQVVLNQQHSLISNYVAELRDQVKQKDRMRFRQNLKRIAMLMAYEISKQMPSQQKLVKSTLGEAKEFTLKEQPVLASIMRAGLPFHQGFLDAFDQADNAFVSAYRKPNKNHESFEIKMEYVASPTLTNRILVLCDAMLATGASISIVLKALREYGEPKQIHIAAVIASKEGLEEVKRRVPAHTKIWVAAVDDELTAQSYIVPGLGDAGDLAFGAKE